MANLATINNNILADSGIDPLSLIVGTGTVNYVPKFTAEDTVANSQIFDNGTGVGIGTTSPSVKLHVVGDILSFGSALFAGTINSTRIVTTADTIQAYWSSEASPRLIAGRDIYVSGQAGIGFGAGNSYAMIGDASATAGTAMGFSVGAPSGSGSSYEKMRITSSGNVGIGTTSPGYTLQVKNSDASVTVSSSDSTAEMRINAQSGLAILETITNTDLRIRTNSTERMRITSGGNVGIGTTAPIYKLQVTGSTYVNGGTLFIDSEQYLRWGNSAQGISGTNDVGLYFLAGSATRMFVSSGGNVGIGTTSPTASLTLNNASEIRFRMNIADVNQLILNHDGSTGVFRTESNTPLTFGTYGSERMRITSGGNVGIGTSSPGYKLEVVGNIQATGGQGLFRVRTDVDGRVDILGQNGYAAFIYFGEVGAADRGVLGYATGSGDLVYRSGANAISNGTERLRVKSTGAVQFNAYGSGSFTGTRAYDLSVDASGNIIEVPVGAGTITGSGTTNYIPKFTSSSAIGNSIVQDYGDNVWVGTNTAGYGTLNIQRFTSAPYATLTLTDQATPSNPIGLYLRSNGSSPVGISSAGAPIAFYTGGPATNEGMRLDASGNLLVGLSSALANGKLQVAGSIGLSGNTQIRQATNSDGNTLQVFATQFVAGNLNSYSYGYSGGGLLASVSAGDSILLFDAGRTTSTEGRVKITNTTLGNVSFSVEKNGVTTLFASTLGNVGIGSANPQVKLDVQSGSIGAYHNTASSGGAQLYLGDMNFAGGAYATSAPGVGAVYGPTHLVAGDLAFYVYNGVASSRSEAMRIIRHSSGNNYVGIGTTTPTTKLHVLSSDNTYANLVIAATSNNGNVTGGLTFGGLYNSDALNFYTGASSTTKMYISNAGNVGIGTTSPGAKLHINDVNSAYTFLYSTISGASPIALDNTSGNLDIYTASTTRMRVTSGGNVLIGTTTDGGYRLDVSGTVRVTSSINIGTYAINRSNSGGYYTGTSDNFGFSYDGAAAYVFNASATPIILGTSNTERIRITAGGSIGIGTSSPQAKLQVTNSTSDGIIISTTANVEPFLAFWRNSASNGVGVLRLIDGGNLYFDNGATGAAQSTKMQLAATGAVRINSYGSGSFTGTVAYNLAVDASGNIIETAGGVVDGSGTTNYISKWSDPNTLTNSLIYDNGSTVSIGLGSTTPSYTNAYGYPQFAVESNLFASSHVFTHNSTDGNYSFFALGKSKGTAAAPTIIENSETIGDIQFWAYDGTAYRNTAFIRNQIDGTPGAGDTPGRLVFATTNDGSSAATEKMRITNGGNVGIGTTSPEAKLDVFGSSSDQIRLRTAASEYYRIGRNASTGYLDFWGSQSGYVGYTWSGVNGERMRLDSSGNLGLGVVPSAWESGFTVLQQNTKYFNAADGSANYQGINAYYNAGWKYIASGTAQYIQQYNGVFAWYQSASGTANAAISWTQAMTLTSSGDLYVGGTTDSYSEANRRVLSLNGGTNALISFRASGSALGYIYAYSTALDIAAVNRSITFSAGVGPAERMRITSSGDVGIGTSSPGDKLQVDGNVYANAFHAVGSIARFVSGGGTFIAGLNGSSYGYIQSYSDTSGTGRALAINPSGGNVGIGTTSPTYTLDVRGTAQVKPTTGTDAIWNRASNDSGEFYLGIDNNAGSGFTGTAYARFLYATGGYPITLHTNGNERMRINSGGDIWFKGASSSTGYEAAFENSNSLFSIYGSRYGGTGKAITLWATGSSESMRINYTNNVLIGTTTDAGYKLNVNGNAKLGSGTSSLALKITGDDNYIEFDNSGTYIKGGGNLTVSATSNLLLFTGASERMRITSGGLVGIGTSSPSDTLHVTGSVRSNSGSSYEVTNHGTFTLNDGTLGNYVDFLVVGSTNVGSSFVELTLSETNIGHGSIKYFIPTNYDDVYVSQTRVVLPLYTTNPRFGYAGGGYGSAIQELQIIANNTGNYTLRLVVRKVGDGSAPAWYWTAKLKNCAVSSTPNTTGINSTAYSLYRHTPLMQYDNKVGIGTTSPTNLLHLYGTDGNSYLRWTSDVATTGARIGYNGTEFRIDQQQNADVTIRTNGSERMRITSGGNVGIGTTSPSEKLQVAGNIGIQNETGLVTDYGPLVGRYNTSQVYVGTGGSYSVVKIARADGGGLNATSGGDVGIGTSSPAYKLDVVGATARVRDSGNVNYVSLSIYGGVYLGGNGTGGVRYAGTETNDNFALVANNSEKVRITTGGYVGIGTSNPTCTLDVRTDSGVLVKGATSDIDGRIALVPASGGRQYGLRNYGSSFGIKDESADVIRMYFHYDGNTGIGTTSPSYKLDVVGNIASNAGTNEAQVFVKNSTSSIYLFNSYAGNTFGIFDGTAGQHRMYYDRGSNFWTFYTGASERMRITSSGNVGIGTTSPGDKLTVNGGVAILAGNSIYFNNPVNTANSSILSPGGGSMSLRSYGVEMIGLSENANILFSTGGTERMRITSGGNILVGTTSDAGYKLDVTGTLRVNGNNNTAVALTVNGSDASEGLVAKFARGASEKNFYISATNNQYVNLATEGNFRFKTGISVNQPYTSGNDPMVLTSTGNVGIGTSSPTVKLQVSGTTLFEGGYANFLASGTIALRIGADGSNDIFMPSGRNLSISAEDNILFRTSGALTERFRITSSGNVGIGTSSPSGQLEVYEGFYKRLFVSYPNSTTTRLSIGHNFYIDNDQSPEITSFTNSSGTSIFRWLQGSTPTERMRLSPSGNLLIGTTSDAGQKLQVNGNGYFNGNLETTVDLVLSRTDVAPAIVTVNGNLRLYKSSGAGAQYSLSYDNDTITFSGSIKTAAPSGGTAATWKLGSRISNTCGLPDTYANFASQFMNTNKVIEVEIGGVTVYIPTVTPGWC